MDDKVLVSFNPNWADEIDFKSLGVMTRKNADWLLESSEIEWPIHIYYGTNEEGDVYKPDFTIKEIPDSLDHEALSELLSESGVDDLLAAATEAIHEKINLAKEKVFRDSYKETVFALPAEAREKIAVLFVAMYVDVKAARVTWQEGERTCPNRPGEWWKFCQCEGCESKGAAYKDAHENFELLWSAFEKKWWLDKVKGYAEHGCLSTNFKDAVNMVVGNE